MPATLDFAALNPARLFEKRLARENGVEAGYACRHRFAQTDKHRP
jgi:hypothetical protein